MGNSLVDYRYRVGVFNLCRPGSPKQSRYSLNGITHARLSMWLGYLSYVSVLLFFLCTVVMYIIKGKTGHCRNKTKRNRQFRHITLYSCLGNFLALYIFSSICMLLVKLANDIELNPGPVLDKKISFCHANVRSLLSSHKLDELSIRATQEDYSIIVTTETWLDASISNHDVSIEDYEIIRRDRNRNGGGIAVFIRSNIGFQPLDDLNNPNYECVWLKITSGHNSFILGSFYVTESTATQANDFIEYLDSVLDLINQLQLSNLPLFLIGDFNAKSSTWFNLQMNNALGIRLQGFVERNHMKQLINEPTRVVGNAISLLDLVITNCENLVDSCGVSAPICNSDHGLIWTTINFTTPKSNFVKSFFDLKGTDLDNLKHVLRSFNWDSMYESPDHSQNIKHWLHNFYELIKTNTKLISCKIRSNDKPWFRNRLRHLISKRHRLYKKAKRSGSSDDWSRYHGVSKECLNAIAEAKESYFKSLFQSLSDFSTSSKKWWHVTKKLIGSNNSSTIPPLVDNNGDVSADTKDKCMLLNEYFASQCKVDDDNTDVPEPEPCTNSSLSDMSFNDAEVKKVIDNLGTSKAVGPDGISNDFIRNIADAIITPLTNFFNYSIRHGIFPEEWKKSNIVPIFKKGDKALPSNYRPVSLLCCLSKVFEKLVAQKFMHYIKQNNLITEHQSGFMPSDSTTNQLIYVTDHILNGFEKGEDSLAVFLDISKAFDKVWHKGLILKLKNNGINGTLLNWFESYLSNRLQKVVYQGVSSNYEKVRAGVPQGSVLGPILFLIYINDITVGLVSLNTLFADDGSLIHRYKNIDEAVEAMHHDLRLIEIWAKKWLVTFNPSKTIFMIFSKKASREASPNLIFFGSRILEVDSHRHLGVTFSNTLNWAKHIENIISSADKRMFILKQLSRKVPRKTLLVLYYSMIRSVLEYGCQVYGDLPAVLSDKLERVQYEAGRIICGALKNTSYEKIRIELGWPTLHSRRNFLSLSLMYKIINGLTPSYIQNVILLHNHNLPYRLNLRNADHVPVRPFRLKSYETSFGISAVRKWNALPRTFRMKPNIEQFKSSLKKEYFPKQRTEFNYGERLHNIFLTRFRLGYTTLNSDLANRGIVESAACPRCRVSPETYSHFFLECSALLAARAELFDRMEGLLHTSLTNISNANLIRIIIFGISTKNCKFNEDLFQLVHNYISDSQRFI